MKATSIVPAVLAAGITGLCSQGLAQTLFKDTFESNTQADYDLKVGYYTGSVDNDYSIEWAYDYSGQVYNFFASATSDPDPRIVPLSPNSAPGETHAIKLTVNKIDDIAERFAINLYPKTTNFSGDFVVKFDAFLNHGAYADTGAGTTEYVLFGINHVGDKINWGVTSGASMASTFATDAVGGTASDGLWFGFVGDDGALRSFQAFEGVASGPSTFLDGALGGIPDRDGNGAADDDGSDPYIRTIFPAPPFEAAGLPGKRWVQVELSQIGNVIKWTIDGKTIGIRTNTSSWTSGRVMIGYADTFAGVAALKDENWALIDNLRVEAVRTVTVDTADNNSPPGDGKTSFLEALTALENNDTIRFNIPGAGPHYIVTPAAGYPLISAQNVTIDGFSQPGASPNTAPINGTNNASIKIVLDSRAGGRFALTDYGDNGFGASESAILPVFFSRNFTLRGVSVLSATGGDSAEDPFIYGVALIGASTEARIQGCWFGIDPANPTAAGVRGGRAAVASFRWDDNTTSAGLIVGTDSDGYGDTNEFNLLTGQLLAVHLQTPYVRVSGNQFNYLPDGSIFDYSKVEGYADSLEAIENGGGDYMLIGTDGDGVYDANERNYFGPVNYGVFAEFWRPALGVVFAGNSIGYGLNGTITYTNPTPVSLLEIRAVSTIRIGTDYSGPAASDALDANHIAGLDVPLIVYHGSNNSSEQPARVSLRGNVLSNNEGEAPLDPTSNPPAEQFYKVALTVPVDNRPTILTNGNATTTSSIRVLVPARNTLNVIEPISLEFYLADISGLTNVSENYPYGWVQGLTFLKHVELEGTFDGGNADVDITDLNLTEAELRRVTVNASYKVIDTPASEITGPVPAAYVTTPFSATLGGADIPATPIVVTIGRSGANVGLSWTGGTAPYQVQFRSSLSGIWENLISTGATTADIPATNNLGFFRISSGN